MARVKTLRIAGYPALYYVRFPYALGAAAFGVFFVLGRNGQGDTIFVEPRAGVQLLRPFPRIPIAAPFLSLKLNILRLNIVVGFGLKTGSIL